MKFIIIGGLVSVALTSCAPVYYADVAVDPVPVVTYNAAPRVYVAPRVDVAPSYRVYYDNPGYQWQYRSYRVY